MHVFFKKILFNTYRRFSFAYRHFQETPVCMVFLKKYYFILTGVSKNENADMCYFFQKKKEKEKQITNFLIKIYIPAFLCPQTPVCVRGKEGGKRAPNLAAFLLGVF